MKKLLVLAVILGASSLYAPALAGGCGCGGGGGGGAGGVGPGAKGDEFNYSNPCPLARAANKLRATGREALASSKAVQGTLAAAVERNLSKI